MKPYLYLFLFFGYSCFACHSSRKIRIENKSGSPAEVLWVIKEDSIHQSPLYTSNSLHSRFEIGHKHPHNKLKMTVGVGSWTPTTLKNFADDLDSMEIRWKSKTLRLDTTTIAAFLSVRRRGIDKSQIVIVLK